MRLGAGTEWWGYTFSRLAISESPTKHEVAIQRLTNDMLKNV